MVQAWMFLCASAETLLLVVLCVFQQVGDEGFLDFAMQLLGGWVLRGVWPCLYSESPNRLLVRLDPSPSSRKPSSTCNVPRDAPNPIDRSQLKPTPFHSNPPAEKQKQKHKNRSSRVSSSERKRRSPPARPSPRRSKRIGWSRTRSPSRSTRRTDSSPSTIPTRRRAPTSRSCRLLLRSSRGGLRNRPRPRRLRQPR